MLNCWYIPSFGSHANILWLKNLDTFLGRCWLPRCDRMFKRLSWGINFLSIISLIFWQQYLFKAVNTFLFAVAPTEARGNFDRVNRGDWPAYKEGKYAERESLLWLHSWNKSKVDKRYWELVAGAPCIVCFSEFALVCKFLWNFIFCAPLICYGVMHLQEALLNSLPKMVNLLSSSVEG